VSQSARRTLLVSIDAACWDYLDPLLNQDRLPNIKRLMDGGVHGTLDSPFPPMTPVAWSSLATGKGPAKHGVYEWVRRKQTDYEFLPFTASHRTGTPFWNRLAAHGLKVGLVNVPLSFPPPQVNGFVVCGFGTPESAQDVTYPTELRDEIESLFGPYQPDIPGALKTGGDTDALFEAERCLQEQQVRIAIAAIERRSVDVLIINLMFLDHANHYLSDMHRVEDAMVHTDSHLGMLLEGFRPDTVLLISDHGSRRVHGAFLLGSWLSEHGYLSWPDHQQVRRDYINWLLHQALQRQQEWAKPLERLARRLAVETWLRAPSGIVHLFWNALKKKFPLRSHHYWAIPGADPKASQVYVGAVSGCLYLNVRGREPCGVVPPEKQHEVLAHLAAELSEIRDPDTGEPLFARIHNHGDLYSDRAIGQPPDLVLDHYSSRWELSLQVPPPVVPRNGYFVRDVDGWYGEHSRTGIFVFAGRDIAVSLNRHSASLLDVPTTLLHLHDVPIPDDYDGRVLTELLEPVFHSTRLVRFQPGDAAGMPQAVSEYSETEAAELLDRLRALGYVE